MIDSGLSQISSALFDKTFSFLRKPESGDRKVSMNFLDILITSCLT